MEASLQDLFFSACQAIRSSRIFPPTASYTTVRDPARVVSREVTRARRNAHPLFRRGLHGRHRTHPPRHRHDVARTSQACRRGLGTPRGPALPAAPPPPGRGRARSHGARTRGQAPRTRTRTQTGPQGAPAGDPRPGARIPGRRDPVAAAHGRGRCPPSRDSRLASPGRPSLGRGHPGHPGAPPGHPLLCRGHLSPDDSACGLEGGGGRAADQCLVRRERGARSAAGHPRGGVHPDRRPGFPDTRGGRADGHRGSRPGFDAGGFLSPTERGRPDSSDRRFPPGREPGGRDRVRGGAGPRGRIRRAPGPHPAAGRPRAHRRGRRAGRHARSRTREVRGTAVCVQRNTGRIAPRGGAGRRRNP